jgi:lipoprotein-anchoring transpeptidase ErfK/SrfK
MKLWAMVIAYRYRVWEYSMLGSRFIVWASVSLISSGIALAETPAVVSADKTASQAQAAGSSAAAGDAFTTDTSKPYIAVAATEGAESLSDPAAAAPPVGETAEAEPAKPVVEPEPSPTLTVNIDLALQQMVVSENGQAKYTWPISSGTAEFPTPRGTFRPQWSAKMWYSRKYDMAPMPHAVFIHGGVAVHATQHISRLGSPASHGCIRLAPGNARTFYNLVHRHGYKATRVAIHGTPKFRAPAIASRQTVKPKQYAVQQQDNGWSFSGSSYYRSTSAYDPNFAKAKPLVAQTLPPQKRLYYRAANGQRAVYVQRPPSSYSGW